MDTIKTKLHTYYLNTDEPDQAEQYQLICELLQAVKPRWMNGISTDSSRMIRENKTEDVILETKHLFNNQWNEADGDDKQGRRLFDWYEEYLHNNARKNIKAGHWLEQTEEMTQIRDNTHGCGYCGHQYPAQMGHIFCPDCLDSEYLSKSDLLKGATRMQPISKERGWIELTPPEIEHLIPQYIHAQTEATGSRNAAKLKKKRADLISGHERAIRIANTEKDGFLWLMDHGVNIENCIYYNHTDLFSFGWRQPVAAEVKSELLDILTEFPHAYEIKAEDGDHVSTRAA